MSSKDQDKPEDDKTSNHDQSEVLSPKSVKNNKKGKKSVTKSAPQNLKYNLNISSKKAEVNDDKDLRTDNKDTDMKDTSFEKIQDEVIEKDISVPQNFVAPESQNVQKIIISSILTSLRATILAIGAQGAINILLTLFKSLRGSSQKKCLKDLFWSESIKNMTKTVSGFTLTWNLLSKLLPKWTGYSQFTNNFLAGSVAGLFTIFESKQNRVDYGLILTVRALHMGVEALKKRGIIDWPNFDEYLFLFGNITVGYAHIFYPNTLPPSTYKTYNRYGEIPNSALAINLAVVDGQQIQTSSLVKALENEGYSIRLLNINNNDMLEGLVPCWSLHPSTHSCVSTSLLKGLRVFRLILPLYVLLNFVPKVFFQFAKTCTNIKEVLFHVSKKSLRSSAFLSSYILVYQYLICKVHFLSNTFPRANLPRPLYVLAIYSTYILTCWMETPQRKLELAIYLAPKGLYSLYMVLFYRNLLPHIPKFEVGLLSLASGVIMALYRSGDTKPFISKMIKKLIDSEVEFSTLFKKEDPKENLDQSIESSLKPS